MLICASLHIDASLSPASLIHSALCSIFLLPIADEISLDFTKRENALKSAKFRTFCIYLTIKQIHFPAFSHHSNGGVKGTE